MLPNVQSKPSLVQLRTNPTCPGCQGEELTPHSPPAFLRKFYRAMRPCLSLLFSRLDKSALSCSSEDIPSNPWMCFVTLLWIPSRTFTFSVPKLPTVLKGRLHQPWSEKCMNIAVWIMSTSYSSLFVITWSQYPFVPSSGQIDICGSCIDKHLCIW